MSDLEDRIAHYMAAEDWVEDPGDAAWWTSRSTEFREDYLASARKVIGIVAHELAEKIREYRDAQYGPGEFKAEKRALNGAADLLDPPLNGD